MKKIFALLLALVMVFSLVACASKTEHSRDRDQDGRNRNRNYDRTKRPKSLLPRKKRPKSPLPKKARFTTLLTSSTATWATSPSSTPPRQVWRSWRPTAASTCKTIEMGGTGRGSAARGCPRCTTFPKTAAYDLDRLRHLSDARLPEGSCHAVSRPAVRSSLTTPPMSARTRTLSTCPTRQNDMGYLVGVYAACMTTDTNVRQHQRGCSRRLRRRR